MNRNSNILTTVIGVAIMSALVFVGSMLSIPIPTILTVSRIHLGNIFCLLAGFMLGGLKGGLAAGLGSMLYDFTNPAYIADSPITFINKFMMGFVCGVIAGGIFRSYASIDRPLKAESDKPLPEGNDTKSKIRRVLILVLRALKRAARLIVAAVAGALTYVVLYICKGLISDIFFLRAEVETAFLSAQVKLVTSLINAAIATIASVPLAIALKNGLRAAGLKRWLGGKA